MRQQNLEHLVQKYKSVINETDKLILPLLASLNINEIAQYNKGYLRYDQNRFDHFIGFEKTRYITALDLVAQTRSGGNICDLGTFIPYLPIMLASLGYEVTIVDLFKFYGSQFEDEIRQIASKKSIKVVDLDILNDDFSSLGKQDFVLLMAVLEHLNGSPKTLMSKIRNLCNKDGTVIVEVPNIAEFSKRIQMLLGRSPLPDYATYFESAYPFMGHNREMTVSEVRYLMENTGFKVKYLSCHDYAVPSTHSIKGQALQFLKKIIPLSDKGQVISVIASPRS